MFFIGNFLHKKCIFEYCDCRSNDQGAKMAFEERKGHENDTCLRRRARNGIYRFSAVCFREELDVRVRSI